MGDSRKTCLCVCCLLIVAIIIGMIAWLAVNGSDNAPPPQTLLPTDCVNRGGQISNGVCYVTPPGSVPFPNATDYCKKEGGHLVDIMSAGENAAVQSAFPSNTTLGWIGLNNELSGSWLWFYLRATPTYLNWAPGMPGTSMAVNGTYQDCAAMYKSNGSWASVPCSMSFPFQCKFALATVPSQPRSVNATAQQRSASLTWSAPVHNGGRDVTGYTIYTRGQAVLNTTNSTIIVVTGLNPNEQYNFTVAAMNDVGTGEPSDISNTVTILASVPDQPTNISCIPGNGVVSVSFIPAYDGGSAITQYQIFNTGGSTALSTSTTLLGFYTVTSPNDQPASFTARTRNAVGLSLESASCTVTPSTTYPSPPATVNAAGAFRSVSLTWNRVGSETSYTLTLEDITNPSQIESSAQTITTSNSTVTVLVPGLTTNHVYRFAVQSCTSTCSVPTYSSPVTLNPVAPDTPASLTHVVNGRSVQLSWTPASDGDSPLQQYFALCTPVTSGATFSATGPGGISSLAVGPMAVGVDYTCTLDATNAVGTSAPATTSQFTTQADAPLPPTNVTGFALGRAVNLTWIVPTDDGGSALASFVVTSNPARALGPVTFNLTTIPAPGSLFPSVIITGLIENVPHVFMVVATNVAPKASAQSDPSSPITPLPVAPGIMTNITAAAGPQSAILWFSPPTDTGGSPILYYTILANNFTWSSNDGNVTSLATGYLRANIPVNVTIQATNAFGSGPWSAPISVTPLPDVPAAPGSITAVPKDGSANLEFDTPDNGGSPITNYTASSNPATQNVTIMHAPAVRQSIKFGGLKNGQTYTFQVYATNSLGNSKLSPPSSPVIPKSSGNYKAWALAVALIILILAIIIGIVVGIYYARENNLWCFAGQSTKSSLDLAQTDLTGKKPESSSPGGSSSSQVASPAPLASGAMGSSGDVHQGAMHSDGMTSSSGGMGGMSSGGMGDGGMGGGGMGGGMHSDGGMGGMSGYGGGGMASPPAASATTEVPIERSADGEY